ncbi:MAG: ABC transporter substrate-binding protein, partial [Chloroflexota bacterium]
YATGLRPSQVRTIRKEMTHATVAQFAALSSRWLIILTTMPPFTDVRVRRAVSLAVDRQAAIKVLEEGEADIGTVFVPGSDWAMPEAELLKLPGFRQPKDADVAEAKKLLAEAGFPKGFKTKILARAKYTDDVAVLMKEQLAKVGIELELVVQESAVFLQQAYEQIYPMVAQPRGLKTSDPEQFSGYFVSGAPQNNMALANEDVDTLFAKQSRATDPAERKKIVRQLDEKLLELSPTVPLFWIRGNIAYWPEVKNYYRGKVYSTNKFQDVWLAK